MKALKSYGIAVIIILIVGAWFSTGIVLQGGKGPADSEFTVVSAIESEGGPITDIVDASGYAIHAHEQEGVNDPALSIAERNKLIAANSGALRVVRVKSFNLQPMKLEVTLRGHTEAKASLAATVETSDIVASVAVREGQSVEEGDLICTLEGGTRQASVNQSGAAVKQAEAALLKAQTDYNTNKALRQKGLASENSRDIFSANLRAAESGLEAAQVGLKNRVDELENTEIRAGLSGVVQGPIVEVGTLLNFGGSCAKIIQLDPMVFVGAVPQLRISLVKLGVPAKIRTINGQNSEGVVTFVSVSSDPATRTFAIEIEFPNADGLIFDGLTAEALVDMGNVPAHLLPQSILTLDADGVLGVKAVQDQKVVFYPLDILADTRQGVWVAGLPLSVDLIVRGQEYVSKGQAVQARFAQ
ncbi:MAG: efflux RND transporter periplasmic adaptor subunit [Marinosulfonomonas sp.]|nr:efflux RND transporter periplasmic adaptor subunit [Marinosulfonomonas sp.]